MKGRIPFLLTLALALIAATPRLPGAETTDSLIANAETVASALAQAEAARQLAADARAEWLQTGSLIEQARTAAESENWQEALALANQARMQSELAVEQAERESVAWRERVVR